MSTTQSGTPSLQPDSPERRGISTLISSLPPDTPYTSRIALSLLMGFMLMFLIEQAISTHAHPSHLPMHFRDRATRSPPEVSFEVDQGEPEQEHRSLIPRRRSSHGDPGAEGSDVVHALPLTLGLAIHGLTDGMALGVSSMTANTHTPDLSLIVFLALLVHKGLSQRPL